MTNSIKITVHILWGGHLGIFTRTRKLPPGEPEKWRHIHEIAAQGQLHRDEEQERLEQQYEKSHLSFHSWDSWDEKAQKLSFKTSHHNGEKMRKKTKNKAIFRGAAGGSGAEFWYSWYPILMAEEGDAPLIGKDPPISIITRSYVWLRSCYKPLSYEHVDRQLLNIDITEKATLWDQLVMSQIWMNMGI